MIDSAGPGGGIPATTIGTAVILCGGRSRRMGTDKARLVVGDQTLLERAVAVGDAVAPRVLLACGSEARYGDLGREQLLDRFPAGAAGAGAARASAVDAARTVHDRGGGPLAGLEAALTAARSDWVAVLACDMPGVEPPVFERLLQSAVERALDLCVLASDAGLEATCGVYHRRCLAAVRSALEAGERKLTSFHDAVAAGSLHERELPGRGLSRNLNTISELRAEVAGLREQEASA
ncbi:MAG: molybdenum cofactor guanylyltransferase [Planctomycetota bacterium]|nr:molybdenum cofactor guanylyltransferase [Planctomycetota bacterium]